MFDIISITFWLSIFDTVLQKYQNVTEMTSNMIYIVALGVGLKCPHKVR